MLKIFLERFRRDPVQGTIVILVFAAHFFLFVIALVAPSFALQKKNLKPLIVKTIAPKITSVEKKSQTTSRSQTPKIAAAPQPKQALQKKQETPKSAPKAATAKPKPAGNKDPAIADKKLAPTKNAPVKKGPPPPPRAKISDSLLQELEESIAKIEKSDQATANKKAPMHNKAFVPITLKIDQQESDVGEGTNDYSASLVHYLHQALSLPDFGEVKIQLSLRQDGTVAKITVLKAQSEKNKHYLESSLPSLQFPRLEGNKKEYTFILTFCNE